MVDPSWFNPIVHHLWPSFPIKSLAIINIPKDKKKVINHHWPYLWFLFTIHHEPVNIITIHHQSFRAASWFHHHSWSRPCNYDSELTGNDHGTNCHNDPARYKLYIHDSNSPPWCPTVWQLIWPRRCMHRDPWAAGAEGKQSPVTHGQTWVI